MSFTYLNLQGKLEHVDVTAEDIDRQLQRLLQANPRIIPVTGRAAACLSPASRSSWWAPTSATM